MDHIGLGAANKFLPPRSSVLVLNCSSAAVPRMSNNSTHVLDNEIPSIDQQTAPFGAVSPIRGTAAFQRREYLGRMPLRSFLAFLSCFAGVALLAQRDAVSTGGVATGTGGSVSFSIGQVANDAPASGTGSVTQGVQQPYDDLSTVIPDHGLDASDVTAFPTVTNDLVVVSVPGSTTSPLRMDVIDALGRIVVHRAIVAARTELSLGALAPGTYRLRVSDGAGPLRTFTLVRIDHP